MKKVIGHNEGQINSQEIIGDDIKMDVQKKISPKSPNP
jgi:hypothetical protein